MMRTIRLELLRRGKANNQLLSPLTEYIALCENHSAVTLQFPFEHNQLLHRLRALSYQIGREPREFQVGDFAAELGTLLSSIPGLIAELAQARALRGVTAPESTVNLQLVISASELALLPFELASSSPAFPGAGEPLLLQTDLPLCITRETRRVRGVRFTWPKRPKILFVYASPPDLEEVPARAHLLALRLALAPWLPQPGELNATEFAEELDKHLGVVCNATIDAVERKLAEDAYTHVHLLAHGVPERNEYDQRYGLAFHHAKNVSGRETVQGDRLASLLCASRSGPRPTIVTLASCNASNVGSVAGVGASISHALHEAGIPLVVASQFPLTFEGSVLMVERLYSGLLWGDDPRELLVLLRRALHSHLQDSHDWASLTAYTSLPQAFDDHLRDARIQQAMAAINTAIRTADRAIARVSKETVDATAPLANEAREQARAAHARLEYGKRRLADVSTYTADDRARVSGLLGSTEKRIAELLYCLLPMEQRLSGPARDEVDLRLQRARDHYQEAHSSDRNNIWVPVQYLSLQILLDAIQVGPDPSETPAGHEISAFWIVQEREMLQIIETSDADKRAWAWCCLVEMYLLAPLVVDTKPAVLADGWVTKAVAAARQVVRLAGVDSFHVFSTRRQIQRYLGWFLEIAPRVATIQDGVKRVLAVLPETVEPNWVY